MPGIVSGPLSQEHLAALASVRTRGRKIRRAAAVAVFSGCTMALFAAITMLGGLFGDLPSLALGIAMGVAAFNEIRGAGKLRRFEASAPAMLGWNQVGLAVVLVVYAIGMLVHSMSHPMLGGGGQSSGDAQVDAMLADVSRMASLVLYGGVGVLGVVGPGLAALYYFSRAKLVRRIAEETPAWVLAALRAAG